jgi:peptidoglycan/LPS O-acetylase OafA/YrhL
MPPREEQPHLAHLKYRPDIDGLRAIAVLSVVGYHAFPSWVPGGFIGVDIFFVISGFLISTIIFGSLTGDGFNYREFYARRIRRIFPALVVVIAVVLGFGWYVLLSDEFRQLGKHVLASAAFVVNFVLWGEAGYFDTAADSKPLLHLWSLAVEEQFYIFWPLLLGFAWHRKGRSVILWVGAAAALSFMVNVLLVYRHPNAAFYLPFSRFWELAAGAALAYWGLRRQPHRSLLRRELRSVSGLLLIAAGLWLIHRENFFPGWWALLPVVGAGLCISAGPGAWLNHGLLGSRVFVWFGLISYPLYLWHWPLLAFARVIDGQAVAPARSVRIAAVLASILLAWLTYRYVERRVRHSGSSKVVAGLSLAMCVLAALGALAFARQLPPRNNEASLQGPVSASSDWAYPDGMRAVTMNGQTIYRIGEGKGRVLMLGDSHVEQFGPRAVELARKDPASMGTVYFATRGACPPVPNVFEDRDLLCGERREALLRIAMGPDVDTVVIGGCWTCYFDVAEGPVAPGAVAATDNYYFLDGTVRRPLRNGDGVPRSLASLESLIKSLRAAGKEVHLLLAIPVGIDFEPRTRVTGSRLGSLSAAPVSPTAPLPLSQQRLNERLRQLAAAGGAGVIEPIAALCSPAFECVRSNADGTPIYKDGVHLRANYVRQFATFLDPVLTGQK